MDVLATSPWSSAVRDPYAALYADATRPLDELVHIEDAAFYVNPLPIYERLQTEAPAYYYEPFNT
jgi:hypothetical protein